MHKIILVFFIFIGFNSFGQLGVIDNNLTSTPPYTGQYKLSSDGDKVYFRGKTGSSKDMVSTNNTYLNPTWISQINAANIGTGIVSTTEFNYLDGLTGNIATTYAPINNPTFTTNATSPKFTITGTGYLANGSDVAFGAGSTADIVTYNPTGRILFSTNGFVRATITNAGNFGIGTIAPTAKFELSGLDAFKYVTGTQGVDKVLLSNASGVASWGLVSLTAGVTGILPIANGGTGLSSLGSGIQTFLGTPTSANLLAALTTKTGTGNAVFSNSPTLIGDIRKDDSNGYFMFANRVADGGNYGVYYNSGSARVELYTNSMSRLFISNTGRVSIGTATASGALDIDSTTGALVIPRMTSAQRTTLTGVNGSIVYQTDGTAGFYFYDNGSWVKK